MHQVLGGRKYSEIKERKKSRRKKKGKEKRNGTLFGKILLSDNI